MNFAVLLPKETTLDDTHSDQIHAKKHAFYISAPSITLNENPPLFSQEQPLKPFKGWAVVEHTFDKKSMIWKPNLQIPYMISHLFSSGKSASASTSKYETQKFDQV